MAAYYNEIDPYAAEWLRNLIKRGHIADGVVDERSIEDVRPSDLTDFVQCHFFAGIGIWSAALRRAGWQDSRPVWTGSCPCQPFSAAGKGDGFDDERHLWPAFYHLIAECRPDVVLGEQVASADAMPWIDLVQTDMEAASYAFGAVITAAAGFGAPNIRQRLYWAAFAAGVGPDVIMADTCGKRLAQRTDDRRVSRTDDEAHARETSERGRSTGSLDHTTGTRHIAEISDPEGDSGQCSGLRVPGSGRGSGSMAEPNDAERRPDIAGGDIAHRPNAGRLKAPGDIGSNSSEHRAGPVNGFWSASDWLACRDGKWRPVEPGTFPLVNGNTSRMGRLRAYGNAINLEQSAHFIMAADDATRSFLNSPE